MSCILLFLLFTKFGALAFGGGYAVIPLLYETFVEEYIVLSATDFGNLISVSQIIPGPTSVNVSAYIGFLQQGILGSVSASLGFVFPSFVLTGSALCMIKKYQSHWLIRGSMEGTRLMALAMLIFSIPLFFNMSVISRAWPMENIFQSMAQQKLIIPEDLTFNFAEFFVFSGGFILLKFGISATKLLILSLILGYGVSFL